MGPNDTSLVWRRHYLLRMNKTQKWIGAGAAAFAVCIGCGGGGGNSFTATVTGLVTDVDGRPARNARVSTDGATGFTTTRGVYVLEGVQTGNRIIKAELEQNGVMYRGQNVALNFEGQLTQSVNIAIAPENSLATVEGFVRDRNGNPLQEANVMAWGGGLSSLRAITDSKGHYEIPGMIPGIEYTLNANGRTYASDYDSITLRNRERVRIDFVLGEGDFTEFGPPQNVFVTSWVSPKSDGRARDEAPAYEAIKRFYNPKRVRKHTRNTIQGNPIEIDVEWDAIDDNDLLGFAVYRSSPQGNPVATPTFVGDPLAIFYADADPALREETVYSYYVTALSTQYPFDPESESLPSETVSVMTLSDLNLSNVTTNPLRFSWQNGSGADEYVVFLFDRYPGVNVTSIWNNDNAPTTNLFLNYSGPRLVPGARYYYIVLGRTSDTSARTLSRVGEFVAPPNSN